MRGGAACRVIVRYPIPHYDCRGALAIYSTTMHRGIIANGAVSYCGTGIVTEYTSAPIVGVDPHSFAIFYAAVFQLRAVISIDETETMPPEGSIIGGEVDRVSLHPHCVQACRTTYDELIVPLEVHHHSRLNRQSGVERYPNLSNHIVRTVIFCPHSPNVTGDLNCPGSVTYNQ